VVSIHTTTTHFLGGMIVLNAGDSRLSAVQIGWSLEGQAQGKEQKFLKAVTTSFLPVAIEPGKVGVVRTTGWRTSDVLQYALDQGLDRFVARAGIVGARFADGSTYTYDLAGRKGFPSSAGDAKVDKLLRLVGPETLDQLNKGIKQSLEVESESFPASQRQVGQADFKPASFTVSSFGKPDPEPDPQQQPAFCCRKVTDKVICGASNTGCNVTPCMTCGTCLQPECGSSCACQVCDVVPKCN